MMLKREGWTVYVMFGKSFKSEEYRALSGPCIELTIAQYAALKPKLEQLNHDGLTEDQFGQAFDDLAKDLSEKGGEPGCGISAIELNRDGKVEIDFEDSLDASEAQDVASQIFFFLRDVCHVHQHHAPTSDTILDVVPYSGADSHWKRETLYSLFRWVIQQKRSRLPASYIDAKGVLAYARAFTEKHCNPEEMPQEFPLYLREATIESLDAGLARAEQEAEVSNRFISRIFNRILPLVGLVLAFLTPFYNSPTGTGVTDQEILVARFAEWFNDNILDVAASFILVVILANVGFVFRSAIFRERFWFDLYRVLYPIPHWVLLGALFVLFGSVVALAVQEYLLITRLPFDYGP